MIQGNSTLTSLSITDIYFNSCSEQINYLYKDLTFLVWLGLLQADFVCCEVLISVSSPLVWGIYFFPTVQYLIAKTNGRVGPTNLTSEHLKQK